MASQLPNVTRLPPNPDLHYDHHGASNGGIGLALTDNPTSFHNPWPSYRFATLSDAWTAYQRGAAVAPAQLPFDCCASGDWQRVASRSSSRMGFRDDNKSSNGASKTGDYDEDSDSDSGRDVPSGAGQLFYDPDDDDNDPDWVPDDGLDNEKSYIPRRITTEIEPINCYIRPELQRIQADDDDDDWREPPVCVVPPRWMKDDGRESDRGEAGRPKTAVTWLGHASVLVQVPFEDGNGMCGILFDPIFSNRCSPTQYVGPARSLDPPCSVAELPPIHVVIISHDHYDHLDYNTIKDLWYEHNQTIHFFVPLNVAQWFTSSGIPESRVTELDWWHEALIQFPASVASYASSEASPGATTPAYPPNVTREPDLDPTARLILKVACTPAQHRSGRGLLDQMATLWASWAVGVVDPNAKTNPLRPGMSDWSTFKVYFGGDTGYRYASAPDSDDTAICPAFNQIGELYGPFSLALLPLSTGSSLPFLRKTLRLSLDQYTLTSSQHCSPADSLKIHAAVKARRTVGMHWGTFCDSAEARATRVEFGRARRDAAVGKDLEAPGLKGVFVAVDIGETVDVDV